MIWVFWRVEIAELSVIVKSLALNPSRNAPLAEAGCGASAKFPALASSVNPIDTCAGVMFDGEFFN
jgi:hypothetical protein